MKFIIISTTVEQETGAQRQGRKKRERENTSEYKCVYGLWSMLYGLWSMVLVVVVVVVTCTLFTVVCSFLTVLFFARFFHRVTVKDTARGGALEELITWQ